MGNVRENHLCQSYYKSNYDWLHYITIFSQFASSLVALGCLGPPPLLRRLPDLAFASGHPGENRDASAKSAK